MTPETWVLTKCEPWGVKVVTYGIIDRMDARRPRVPRVAGVAASALLAACVGDEAPAGSPAVPCSGALDTWWAAVAPEVLDVRRTSRAAVAIRAPVAVGEAVNGQ